jgi:inorganic pyrophosphatase
MDRPLHCATVTVRIEVPRGGVVKRRANGSLDFVSPLPCPFNYGCVPEQLGGDGDPLDALVLGPRLAPGALVTTQVFAVVRFLDAGQVDDKLVCGPSEPSEVEQAAILTFFRWYARAKRVLHAWRREPTDTRLLGWVWSREIEARP